jgi:hypothetical protein
MEKLILAALICIGFNSYGQVTKADFITLFNKFPSYKHEKIVVSNIRIFENDSTSSGRWGVRTFKTKLCSYEIDDHAFYIKSYKDTSQFFLTNVYMIPFQRIATLSVEEKALTIYMSE